MTFYMVKQNYETLVEKQLKKLVILFKNHKSISL